jgi:hypothetical protein
VKETAARRVCRYLAANGPADASSVGAAIWRDLKRRGRIYSVNGGGDYAAQMLLGRLKKTGLVQHAQSKGASRWELTWEGRKEAAK